MKIDINALVWQSPSPQLILQDPRAKRRMCEPHPLPMPARNRMRARVTRARTDASTGAAKDGNGHQGCQPPPGACGC
eukprot:2446881-Pleurochrysis_carterae.AAC.4